MKGDLMMKSSEVKQKTLAHDSVRHFTVSDIRNEVLM